MQLRMNTNQVGFSLIEMMVVLIIVGILAGIALPTYQSQMQKTRRGDVQSQLLDYVAQFERCYTGTFNYDTCNDSILADDVNYPSAGNNDYTISAAAAQETYTITATATEGGRQDGDTQIGTNCEVLTVTNTGAQTPGDCW